MAKKIFILIISLIPLSGFSQSISENIIVDQFGYRPQSKKIAVIKNPITGFDTANSYTPGNSFALVEATSNQNVLTSNVVSWKNGLEDPSSGDQVWWFDFSAYQTPGEYYILDIQNNVKSFTFQIADDIYNEVLKQAMRVWFYQRSGYPKLIPYADSNWEDGASHIGPLQDKNCRYYLTPNDASSERDVHGGWYDAGDLNKYTPWTANYVVELLRAYKEHPNVWTDDYNIPESGNGVPDILDEVKWGLDHLLRLQNPDGSMIAVVDAGHASPPSAASDPSLYGGTNTVSALTSAGAFALGAIIYDEVGETDYADTLLARAIKAWDWAEQNPAVLWYNNDANYGTSGIGAGQQEVNDYKRLGYKLRAAGLLFEATNDNQYDSYFTQNYNQLNMFNWNFVYPFEDEEQDILLHYLGLSNADVTVANDIKTVFNSAMEKEHNFQAIDDLTDPYMAHMDAYTWGSNKQKAAQGLIYWMVNFHNLNSTRTDLALEAAEDYIHYFHGVNPLNMVYLTNMGAFGAEKSVSQIYHTWFTHGSDWDEVGSSLYGPPPGIVPGGPNPNYSVDGCCPSGCGSAANNAKCSSVDLTQVTNQPKQKSFLEFNEGWPLNSWSVTENSMGYQAEYVRLLSKFIAEPTTTSHNEINVYSQLKVYPNPTSDILHIGGVVGKVFVYDAKGKLVMQLPATNSISTSELEAGVYFIVVNQARTTFVKK